jgi:flagellar L-ring protein FlgH
LVRRLFKYFLLISLSLFSFQIVIADSIYDNAKVPYYGVNRRRIRVGDIVTVYISESTSAVQSASTSTKKDSTLETELKSDWQQVASLLGDETIRKTFDFELSGGDEYLGSGSTTRRSKVQAVVTSVVTEILDSGNLFIVGEHQVKVNNEIETVRVSGIIDPKKISAKNSVFSWEIAKAEISVNGVGVVAAKQTPGVLTKMLNWLY